MARCMDGKAGPTAWSDRSRGLAILLAVGLCSEGCGKSRPAPALPPPSGPPGPFALRVTRTGGGRVTGVAGAIACGNVCAATVAKGETVRLTPGADAHSRFLGWSGHCSGTGVCTLSMDGDKDVAASFSDCPGAQSWSKAFGGSRDDRAVAAAIDASGDLALTGSFHGTASFGGSALASTGGRDVFAAKVSPAGAHRWSVRLGGANEDEAFALASHPSGDFIVAGRFQGTASFGTTTLASAGGYDGFVARLAGADGSVVWAVALGGIYHDVVRAAAVDANGDVLVAGGFHGAVTFGPNALAAGGFSDAFVAKLSGADGSVLWARSGGGTGYDESRAIAVDPATGDALVSGVFQPGAAFGSTTLPGTSSPVAVFAARYAGADGAPGWAVQMGNIASDDAAAIAVDPSGDVLVGWTSAFMTLFQGGPSTSPWEVPEVTRLSPAGQVRWTVALGPADTKILRALAVDGSGRILVAGALSGDAGFGAAVHLGAGVTSDRLDLDAWWALLAADGSLLWSERFGGPGRDEALALATRGTAAFAAGYFSRWVDACGGLLASAGEADAFVVSLGQELSAPGSGGVLVSPEAPAGPSPAGLCQAPSTWPQAAAVAGTPVYATIPVTGPILGYGNLAATGDFDGDGDEDAFVIASNDFYYTFSASIWHNDGTGQLADVPLPPSELVQLDAPLEIRTLDADLDGRLDAFVLQSGYDFFPWPGARQLLFLQGADGKHVDATLDRFPPKTSADFAAAVGDVDCDGAPDVYHVTGLLLNDGTGRFHDEIASRLPPASATAAAFCDVNRDGAPELVLGDTGGADPSRLLLNDGLGRFTVATGALPPKHFAKGQVQVIACADLDRDGWNDLAALEADLAAPGVFISYWHNLGDGSFEDLTAAKMPQTDMGSTYLQAADLNGDGWPDLVASGGGCNGRALPSDYQIFLNQGGSFVERIDLLPGGATPGCSRIYPMRAAAGGAPGLLRVRAGVASEVLVRTAPPP